MKKKKVKSAAKPKAKRERHQPYQPVVELSHAVKMRHEAFCVAYSSNGGNATEAAKTAGYAEVGAGVKGSCLLKKANILARIKQLEDERNARVLMEGDDILREIQKLAKSDIRRLIDPKTQCFLPTTEWPDDIAVCVSSIEVKELFNRQGVLIGYIKKLKLWDKPKPQELMGKNKRLFVDVVESTNEHTVSTVDAAAVKKMMDEVEGEV